MMIVMYTNPEASIMNCAPARVLGCNGFSEFLTSNPVLHLLGKITSYGCFSENRVDVTSSRKFYLEQNQIIGVSSAGELVRGKIAVGHPWFRGFFD